MMNSNWRVGKRDWFIFFLIIMVFIIGIWTIIESILNNLI
jgi:hypothetical protein